jgi:methylaspartate mutase epsilon subunit
MFANVAAVAQEIDARGCELPDEDDTIRFVRQLRKPSAAEVLRRCRTQDRVAIQPRSGVGGHQAMAELLRQLETNAAPDILAVTIDSYTRLGQFETAARLMVSDAGRLNGYPLVAHGWERGRALNAETAAPLDIRHGSPDARRLFEIAMASGITAFEGGGLTYNIPYAKTVPLRTSLASWRVIDRACGRMAERGLVVAREMFGTLTAVLVPPSTALAICVLEALAAVQEGVRCVLIACAQGGNAVQDVATLRAIPCLGAKYLPPGIEVHAVLHQYMGPFPPDRARADALILSGALVARLGGASKIVTKTHDEAFGIPSAAANVLGVQTTRAGLSDLFAFVRLDEDAVDEEQAWIERETDELLAPVLAEADLFEGIARAFEAGCLDVPFSPSRYVHGRVIPMRDADGAIRYHDAADMSLSESSRRRNHCLLNRRDPVFGDGLLGRVIGDVFRFSDRRW